MIDDHVGQPSPAPRGRLSRSGLRRALVVLLGPDALRASGPSSDHETEQGEGARRAGLLPPRPRLFVLSFLMLFIELMVIRWTGANVIYLSYFSNFVLLGSFLGIGIGFLRARSRVNLFPWAPVTLALLVAFVLRFPVQIVRPGGQLVFFGSALNTTGLPAWVTLPVVFLAVAAVMAMIGEGVARSFAQFRPLDAYRLDILGSITGILAFSALSFIGAKPMVWALIVVTALLVLYGRRIGVIQAGALAGLLVMLGAQSLSSADIWSPYYRISVIKQQHQYGIEVNGIPHQSIQSAASRRAFYFLPYQQSPANPLSNVLVIGAGTGNDVAEALQEGAKHIDAVEIDPQLYLLGKRLHPNRPYQDPRVSVHINDGRAFLQQATSKYDMILFALPDSLTLVSGQSSLRLESYLFTLQAMQAAKAHLNPADGVFSMYNYYRTTWLRDRLAGTLETAYGHAPCANSVGSAQGRLSMLTVSVNPAALHCGQVWQRPSTVVQPATDDHPFVYLYGGTIPGFYLLTLALILLASAALTRAVSGPVRNMTGYADLFFMGAAFMLLETKSVVQFALLFGTTWFVNAMVFTGVLVAVLAAVEVSRQVIVRRPRVLYGVLLASLIVAWAIPLQALLSLSLLTRFVVAVVITFTPIFLANMVFTQRFRDVADSTGAFGANLLGAMVGGILEYTSLIIGYRSLVIMVAVLYGLAFVTAGGRARGLSPPTRAGIPRAQQPSPSSSAR